VLKLALQSPYHNCEVALNVYVIMFAGQDCNRYQFECHNIDKPMQSECIAVYDACDGVVQCSDGSDEVSCSKQPGLYCVVRIDAFKYVSK